MLIKILTIINKIHWCYSKVLLTVPTRDFLGPYMTIVSLSLPEELVRSMEEMRSSQGYAGRSELIRASLRLMLDDAREKDSLKGVVNAILVITHDEFNEEPITKLKHQFEDIVKTHIHSKISHSNCVELFLLEGEGKKVSSMTRAFQKEDRLRSVKLIVI